MKRIIMFEGDIETQGYFSVQMKKRLEQLGHEVFLYDLQKPYIATPQMLRFIERGNTVVLSFNFHGMCQEAQFMDTEGTYLWDGLGIPCLNILADHPYYYYKLLAQRPKNYIQLSIDRGHESFMKRFFPEIPMGPFTPLAGTALFEKTKPIAERDIEVVFTGNYASPKRFEQYITRVDEEYTQFYYEMLGDLRKNPNQTVEAVVERYLRREIPEVTEEELKETMQNITFLDLYIRYQTRGEVVKTLVDNGIKVHVFGDKWNELEVKHPENLIDGDSLFSEECLEMISRSKISINVLPWFKEGPHDRIYNTMLNGAVCLTDSNVYLDQQLVDGENCSIYDLTQLNKLPQMVTDLLSNPETMQQIADKGLRLASEHTWAKRMDELSTYIENL